MSPAPSGNALEELATLVALLLRLRPDRAAFRVAEAHILGLASPIARLAVGRALQATRPPSAPEPPPVSGGEAAPLGPVDPAVLEASVLELLRQARQWGHSDPPGRGGA